MGLTYVIASVCNPADPKRAFDERCLVDTGAVFSFLPRDKLAAIGVTTTRRERFRQMDGTTIERDMGRALLRVEGKEEVVPVVLAEPNDATVLGVVALEALALGIDPTSGEVKPVTVLAVSAFSSR